MEKAPTSQVYIKKTHFFFIILLNLIVFINSGSPKDIRKSDYKIYSIILDTMTCFPELRVEITPEKLARHFFLNMLFENEDSLYFTEFTKDLSKPFKNDTIDFTCDTCIYVAYLNFHTTIIYAHNFLKSSEYTLKNNINWPKDTLKSVYLPFKEYNSKTIKYICLTNKRRKNLDYSLSQHPMDSLNRLLYTNYGNYYVGDFVFSRILYSVDNQYAYTFVMYDGFKYFEFYFHKISDDWVLENIIKN